MFLANSPSRLQQRQPRLEQASVVIRKWWSYTGEGFACQARVKQGFRGALPRACVTMSACKRTCALQGQTAAIASYCEGEAGNSCSMLRACATVCACKRRCALQGLQQRCSRDFGSHAIRLRNGIGLQADTPSAKHGARRLTRIVSSFAKHCTRRTGRQCLDRRNIPVVARHDTALTLHFLRFDR